tara:strand:- start:6128 stop:7042 length:915 start_codon:yes stop_codon:yes gene_type:complete
MSLSKSSSDSNTTMDPQIKGALFDVFNTGKQVAAQPYQAYDQARVAPFSPFQLQGQQATVDTARGGFGQNEVNLAANTAFNESQYQPNQVASTQVTPNLFRNTDMNNYMNPYTTGAIDAAMGDIERQRQIQETNIAGSAQAANAFGGTRHGIQESENNRNALDIGGRLAADMRNTGYNQATGLAMQDIGNQMNAQQLNQQAMLQAQLSNQAAGLQGSQNRLDAGGMLGDLGGTMRGMRYGDAAALSGVGDLQQGQGQRIMDDQYGRFAEERDYPIRMLDILRGVSGLLPSPTMQKSSSSGFGLG